MSGVRPTEGMFGKTLTDEERDALIFVGAPQGGGFWFLPELSSHTPLDQAPPGEYGNPDMASASPLAPLDDPDDNRDDGRP